MVYKSERKNILISYESSISIRSLPINFEDKHKRIFVTEFQKRIPRCYAKIEKSVCIIDNSICHFLGFGSLSKYSKSAAAGRKAKLLRIIKFFKLFQRTISISKGCWILDDWSSGYFHWFADALTRAELVCEYTHNYPVILPAEYKGIGYIQKSLEILGIKCIYLDREKPIKVQELLLTSYTAPTGNYNKVLLANLAKRFRNWVEEQQDLTNKCNIKTKRKIYLSRAKTYRRKITNESELLPIFKKYGFEVLHAEDINFEEQLRIFYTTSVLVGLHGAGLTNMMFMQSGGIVIEIRRHGDAHNNCFFTMASDLDMKYSYLFAQSENNDMSFGNCYVDPEHLEFILSQYNN